ncbi:MAG: NTP transferase domain-containing protein [Polyangiaceae bacterium]|nr:NTP transferase domain-containing protein [Polyangiaceae bacterium]
MVDLTSPAQPFSALVLAAGFGTRLSPLTKEIPKPLVPLGDRSLLATTLTELHAAGAGHLAVNTHHHAAQIREEVERLKFAVSLSHEETILGTAGGVKAALQLLPRQHLIVVNGDIVG